MSDIPFKIEIGPGSPAYEQVIHAVHKALANGLLAPGASFPSVRALSKAAKINPNTAHKVVQALISEGTLEVIPGRGTRIAEFKELSANDKESLITDDLHKLIIEAKRLQFTEQELIKLIKNYWKTTSE